MDSDQDFVDCESSTVKKSLVTGDIEFLIGTSQSTIDFTDDNKSVIYDLDCKRVLVVLNHPSKFYFYAAVSVSCISGSVELFGYTLTRDNSPVKVFSLLGNAALYFSSMECAPCHIDLQSIIRLGFGVMEATKLFSNIQQHGSSLLMLEKISLPYSLSNQPKICVKTCSRAEKILDSRFENVSNDSSFRKISIDADIERLTITFSSRYVICAGQGLGKSTTLRYLVNKALNNYDKVLYIDTDIGQSEFTLPEAISAIIVDEPLLGPPYTHFKKPILSYHMGTNNASDCVEAYLKAVKKIGEECSKNSNLSNIPWMINTMGFSKGIGVVLTANTIYFLKPSHVIQIQGNSARNYSSLLTPSFVSSVVSMDVHQYSLITVNAFKENSKMEGLYSNAEMRWLGIQAYFNNILRPSYYLALPSKAVEIVNCKMKKEISSLYYHLLGTKIVTLCTWDTPEDIPSVYDYGIIIGYDKDSSNFIVLTPAEENNDIKAVHLGSLQIASKVSKCLQTSIKGLIPYIQIGPSSAGLTKPVRRTFRYLFEKSLR